MARNDKKLLLHSLCHIAIIDSFSSDKKTYEEFINDFNALDSILFHLIQIGEICTNYSDEFCKQYDYIDFKNIKGLRNIVVHDYTGIIYNEIFDIVCSDLPKLKDDYSNILVDDMKLSEEYINNYIKYYLNNRKFLDI